MFPFRDSREGKKIARTFDNHRIPNSLFDLMTKVKEISKKE